MPTLSAPLTADGAVVHVEFAWGTSTARTQRMSLQPVPPPVHSRAILDSGAEVTCIDSRLARTLGLPLGGFTLANVPADSGLTIGTYHDVHLTVLHPSGNARRHFVVGDRNVLELSLSTLGYDAILGRDVLAVCQFLYDGPKNRFRLTY